MQSLLRFFTEAVAEDDMRFSGFRLSASSTLPVPTTDITAQATIYLQAFRSNEIWLRSGAVWVKRFAVTAPSLALSGLTSGANYDVFAYWSGSAVTLELSAAWTNDTTRADAIARVDGVWSKNSDNSRRLVGTIRTTSTTTTEDSNAKRFVFSSDNMVYRPSLQKDTTASWNFTSNTYVAMNSGSASWLHEFVEGLNQSPFNCVSKTWSFPAGGDGDYISIGFDSTSTEDADATTSTVGSVGPQEARLTRFSGIGYHFTQGLERSVSSGSTFNYGANKLAGFFNERFF